MDDEGYGGFFQFPLCIYAQPGPFENVLNQAFYHGVISFLDQTSEDGSSFEYLSAKTQEKRLQRARDVIGFSRGSAATFIEGARAAYSQVIRWQNRYGKSCLVRVKKDFHFAARDNGEITEREMRVLVGIYSVIGAKPYAKLGWPMIQARAAGHPRPGISDVPQELRGPIYSRGQIDRTCQELIARRFVSSFTYNQGERFWSHSLTAEDLAAKITNRKEWRKKAAEEHAAFNKATTAAIKAKLAGPEPTEKEAI